MNTKRVYGFGYFNNRDELLNDRLPGMPLVGFVAGTICSMAIWGAIAIVAWRLVA